MSKLNKVVANAALFVIGMLLALLYRGLELCLDGLDVVLPLIEKRLYELEDE